jgi:hypothetical protein
VFATAILLGGAASTASAGEITGNGKPTQGPAHANSICAFSGLEDGDGAGFPGPGGAPPQNWGHSKEAFGATPAERKASGSSPATPATATPGSWSTRRLARHRNQKSSKPRARASARALVIPPRAT